MSWTCAPDYAVIKTGRSEILPACPPPDFEIFVKSRFRGRGDEQDQPGWTRWACAVTAGKTFAGAARARSVSRCHATVGSFTCAEVLQARS